MPSCFFPVFSSQQAAALAIAAAVAVVAPSPFVCQRKNGKKNVNERDSVCSIESRYGEPVTAMTSFRNLFFVERRRRQRKKSVCVCACFEKGVA